MKLYYDTKINYIKNDSKKLWSTLNEILGKKANSAPSFIESGGSFITKPTDIANYFNDFVIGKIRKHRHDMPATNDDTTHPSIIDQIMKDKDCNLFFTFMEKVKIVLLSINNDKPPRSDNLDGK